MFLGLDLGTSGLKGVLLDENDRLVAQATASLAVHRPQPGWSEQDPKEWITAAKSVFAHLKQTNPQNLQGVKAIGLSGQMHGATLLDTASKPLRSCILWNDTRAQIEAEAMDALPLFREQSGNRVFAGFTAPKLSWVQENEPSIFAQIAKILLPKDYLRLWLTGEFISDPSDASGTSWLNPETRTWDESLLTATNLDLSHMPSLVEGNAISGQVRKDLAENLGLDTRTTIYVAGGAGDNAATAVGLGLIYQAHSGFLSLGTSGVVMVPGTQHAPNPDRAVHAFCHALPDRWLQMGVMLACTDALNWYARTMGQSIQALTGGLPATILPPSTALFFPYLGGERTPYASATLRGGWQGLGFEHTQEIMTHAVLQGVSFALKDNLEALARKPNHLIVAGGGTGSAYWLQLLATILQTPLHCSDQAANAAALGGARLGRACLDRGYNFGNPEISKVIEPDKILREAYADSYRMFRQSVEQVSL